MIEFLCNYLPSCYIFYVGTASERHSMHIFCSINIHPVRPERMVGQGFPFPLFSPGSVAVYSRALTNIHVSQAWLLFSGSLYK